ncbi:MAG: methylmalonyl-CoA mutase family protein [Solirubrobacterales bacterium]
MPGPENDNFTEGFNPVSQEEWAEAAGKGLENPTLQTELEDGIETKWLYTREDSLAPDPAGLPNEAPFVRGTRAGRHWQIRQVHSHPDRSIANAEILEDLNGGVTEVTLAFDQAARKGLGPEAAEFEENRGLDGIAISTLDDISLVLDGVFLDMAGIALDAGAATLPAAALLNAHWRENGIAPESAIASFRADPLGTLVRDGSLPFSPEEGLARAANLALETSRTFTKVRALGVDTSAYVEAGASTAWELGIAIATAVEHLRAGLAAGVDPATVAAQIEFNLGVGADQFLEMAKFRAIRRIWSRVLEECGVPAEARHSATYAQTTARMITAIDPWVNMLRVTTGAFAAGTGGADGVTVTPFDRAIGQPGALGRRIARNTQIVLQDESSLGRIADPAAGSWYVEVLTDEVAQAAWQRFTEIEKEGGALAALRSGLIATRLAEQADIREDEFAHRVRVMTGINEFPLLGDDGTEPETVNREAVARLDAARLAERPDVSGLDQLRSTAASERLAKATSLASSGARIDEIGAALNEGGAGRTVLEAPIEPRPDSAPFEHLRTAARDHEAAGRDRPQIYLACMGAIASHVNLANWAKSFFEVSGIETVPSGALDGNTDQARTFKDGGFSVAAVCASKRETAEDVADLVTQLRDAGAEYVYMINSTPELNEAAAADEVLKNGVNMVEVLTAALERLGVEVSS